MHALKTHTQYYELSCIKQNSMPIQVIQMLCVAERQSVRYTFFCVRLLFLFPSSISNAGSILFSIAENISPRVTSVSKHCISAALVRTEIVHRQRAAIRRPTGCNDINSPQPRPPECLHMFLSDFADFFIKTGLEGMNDCLLTDPAMPCLLRPEGHPGSELAKVYGNQGKRCGSTLYELCTAPWHRPCTLVIIFVAYKKGVWME